MRLFYLLTVAAIASGFLSAQEAKTVAVQFEKGYDSALVPGRITGEEMVIYELKARDGQFLSVSLRPDNQSANYNIYIPGRGPGDEALFGSATGGHEYTGQLYKNGVHRISVFLVRAAARRGETANYDIAFRVTDNQPDRPIPAEIGPANSMPGTDPVEGIAMEEGEHGPLLERQAALPRSMDGSPVGIAVAVLSPDLVGVITSVQTKFDTMENPAEVEVAVSEGGILDDDLLGIEHRISLARNNNGEWRVVGYRRGQKRR